jgi:hypothetical protein
MFKKRKQNPKFCFSPLLSAEGMIFQEHLGIGGAKEQQGELP